MSIGAPLRRRGGPATVPYPMPARTPPVTLPKGVDPALDERARRVLAAIVRDYIHSGEPVGSHAIARRSDVDVS